MVLQDFFLRQMGISSSVQALRMDLEGTFGREGVSLVEEITEETIDGSVSLDSSQSASTPFMKKTSWLSASSTLLELASGKADGRKEEAISKEILSR